MNGKNINCQSVQNGDRVIDTKYTNIFMGCMHTHKQLWSALAHRTKSISISYWSWSWAYLLWSIINAWRREKHRERGIAHIGLLSLACAHILHTTVWGGGAFLELQPACGHTFSYYWPTLKTVLVSNIFSRPIQPTVLLVCLVSPARTSIWLWQGNQAAMGLLDWL